MDALINRYKGLLNKISTDFKRGLSYHISWDARAICIEGARGTGKSTLMLQQIKENLSQDKTLYLSLDDLYFKEHNLIDVAEKFYNQGGRHLFIDEVHKYQEWQQSVKNIYDFYPELQIVVSGSSILELQKSQADLSRRLLVYNLPELSLREYIALKHGINLPAYSLETILTQHSEITSEIQKQIPSPLAVLSAYLSYGSYPFFMEGENDYFMRLNQLINVIIDYDLPEAKAIAVTTQAKLKKLLYVISTSVPFQPNISRLAQKTETSRIRLLEMLHILEQAQLIRNLRSSAHGVSLMNKPSKIYLRNTNLIAALSEGNPNAGNIRETFFLSQVQNSGGVVTYPKKGDFLVNGKFLFEIGGKNKSNLQISEYPNSFVVADEIEHGWQNKIPLWLFGFLY